MPRSEVERAVEQASTSKRKQKTWYLTEDIIGRINAAVYWALPKGLAKAAADPEFEVDPSRIPDSASALVESALWGEVLRLEHLYNEGDPFPPAPGKLRTGPRKEGIERLKEPRRRDPE